MAVRAARAGWPSAVRPVPAPPGATLVGVSPARVSPSGVSPARASRETTPVKGPETSRWWRIAAASAARSWSWAGTSIVTAPLPRIRRTCVVHGSSACPSATRRARCRRAYRRRSGSGGARRCAGASRPRWPGRRACGASRAVRAGRGRARRRRRPARRRGSRTPGPGRRPRTPRPRRSRRPGRSGGGRCRVGPEPLPAERVGRQVHPAGTGALQERRPVDGWPAACSRATAVIRERSSSRPVRSAGTTTGAGRFSSARVSRVSWAREHRTPSGPSSR